MSKWIRVDDIESLFDKLEVITVGREDVYLREEVDDILYKVHYLKDEDVLDEING